MIAQAALREAIVRLKEAGVQDPAIDARLLLAHAMGIGSDRLTLHSGDELTRAQSQAFSANVDRRVQRQPVSQIIGSRAFFGRHFAVTQDVLDPRPETEILVLEALKIPFKSVLDIGTGSGCILLTLLAERLEICGTGVDISPAALQVAENNASALGVSERSELYASDWFDAVEGKFDLIVSNPPYIDEAEWHTLDPEPRKWEPKQALTPGADGLQPYRIIADNARKHLSRCGQLMVEIGWRQGPDVAAIFANAGLQKVRIEQDLDGRDRVIIAQNP